VCACHLYLALCVEFTRTCLLSTAQNQLLL
jgi:hypothetical protein